MRSDLTEQREKLKRGFVARKSFGDNYADRTMDVSKFTQSIQKFKDMEQTQIAQLNSQIEDLKSEQSIIEVRITEEKNKKQQIVDEISITCTKSLNKIGSCAQKFYSDPNTIEYLMAGTVSLSQLLQDVLQPDYAELLDSFQIELETNLEKTKKEIEELEIKEKSPRYQSDEINTLTDNYNTLKKQYDNLEVFIRNHHKFELDEAKSKIKSLQAQAGSIATELQQINSKLKTIEEQPSTLFNESLFEELKKHLKSQTNLLTQKETKVIELKSSIMKQNLENEKIDLEIQQTQQEIDEIMKELLQ